MQKQLHFWFDFASTYTYPAVMRLNQLIKDKNIEVIWHPFLLGAIFQQQGWNDSPFNIYPVKGKYMWRDLERICQQEQIAFNQPSVFPRNGLLPARVVANFADQAWVSDFIQAVFAANFVHDLDINQPVVIENILKKLQLDAPAILAQASSDEGKQALKQQTALAQQQQVFGAPFFIVDNEPFWGNDRLQQAIDYACHKNSA